MNKLGEYMVATASRRERIIRDQKRPKAFKSTRYNDAQEAITSYLVDGAKDDYLYAEIERLYTTNPANPWQLQNNQLCAEAPESFLDVVDEIPLEGLELRRGVADAPKLHIGEVAVSVRPEIILTGTNRAGEQINGALKLYFPKSFPLDKRAGEYVGTTLHQFVTMYPVAAGKPDYQWCFVVDVSGGEVFTAPRSHKRRRSDIEAACREIARAWSEH